MRDPQTLKYAYVDTLKREESVSLYIRLEEKTFTTQIKTLLAKKLKF